MEQAKLEQLREAARQIRIGIINSTITFEANVPAPSISVFDIRFLYLLILISADADQSQFSQL